MPTIAIDNSSYKGKKRQKLVRVPVMAEAINQLMALSEDIQTILDAGITRRCLGRSLGVSFVTTWRWQKGIRTPNVLMAFALKLWAEEVRKQKEGVTDNDS